ncbi:ATP synthase subunit C lysine N-methyltransferase-like isoform X3 [Dendrobates tinctorius]|uniref:ATP synthase subunit C lysine N-methyltransferase-like isoform X3 n=1 Tax=Dendrobates tinctorius TaxID=92724 RepID=UPI003CC96E44
MVRVLVFPAGECIVITVEKINVLVLFADITESDKNEVIRRRRIVYNLQNALKVFTTASMGFHSTGYELNPILLNWAKVMAYRRGISRQQAIFLKQDFWAADLSKYSNVTVFLAPGVVETLKKKLADELPDDARVIVCRFPLIGWSPTCTEGTGLDQVWAYDMANVRRVYQPMS